MIIFIIILYAFAAVAIQYSIKFHLLEKQQQNRVALNTIKTYYSNKHNEFTNILTPLFENRDYYNTINELIDVKNGDEYLMKPYFKQKAVKLFMEMVSKDNDILGVYVHKMSNAKSYIFDRNKLIFERTPTSFEYESQLMIKTIGRNSYKEASYETTISGKKTIKKVYAISGIFGAGGNELNSANFVVMYDTRVLDKIMDEYVGTTNGRFLIINDQGDIIYDSYGDYKKKFLNYEAVLSGQEKIVIENDTYYVQTIKDDYKQYAAVHLISETELGLDKTLFPRYIVIVFFTIVTIYSVLYVASAYFATKKVESVIKGMHKIGTHNLHYRIPVNAKNKMKDEFQEIAIKFNEMCDQLQTFIEMEYINELKKKNAELSALQSWIDPHFLYNTLEVIRIKALDDGNADVSEMIVLLANLFRNIVKEDQVISIYKEANICQMYLSVLLLRFSDNFIYNIDIAPNVMQYGIPKNIIQPLIENYFVHGIKKGSYDNEFNLRATMDKGDIVFVLEDNGLGIDSERLKILQDQLSKLKSVGKTGDALFNVHERIIIIYGKKYGLSVKSVQNKGTQVELRIKALTCEEINKQLNPDKG